MKPLSCIAELETVVVSGFAPSLSPSQKQRLIDLGFMVGCSVTCLQNIALIKTKVFALESTVYALEYQVLKDIYYHQKP